MLQFGRIWAVVLCRLTLSIEVSVRAADAQDLEAIRGIYNQGIEDRCVTLETSPYDVEDITAWWTQHSERYVVLVAEDQNGETVAWASLNRKIVLHALNDNLAGRRLYESSVFAKSASFASTANLTEDSLTSS